MSIPQDSRNAPAAGGIHVGAAALEFEMAETVDRLTESFSGEGCREDVEREVADAVKRLQPARITTFIPVLAERRARERLQQLSVAQGDHRP